jgi:CBS domain-containing protein
MVIELSRSWRNDLVREAMTGNIIRIPSDATMHEAQTLMIQSKLTRLVVTDRAGKLRGIITLRDVVRFLSRDSTERGLDQMKVKEATSTPAITIPPSSTLVDAARTMNKNGISSIVATDNRDEILGIVTKTDLCFHFSLFTSTERVGDFMTRKVFTVKPTHSIFFVVSILARQGVSRVPVVDGQLLGIIALSDIVRSAPLMRPELIRGKGRNRLLRELQLPSAKLTAMTASDLMTTRPVTITSNDLLSRAAELMIEHGISGLPVTDPKGNVRGIVTKTDVVRAIAK